MPFRRRKNKNTFPSPPKLEEVDPKEIDHVPHKNKIIRARVVDVYDGDTCTVIFGYGNSFLKFKIRVLGVDTPEKVVRGYDRDDSEEVEMAKLEEEAGEFVAEKVRNIIDQKILDIKIKKWDMYGGRLNGEIFLDTVLEKSEPGYTLSDYLLDKKYAKPYTGRGKKEKWTQEELGYILSKK